MSFNQMKRDELFELATENFAVEVDQSANKARIIAALAENGVTWDMAKVTDKNAAAYEAKNLEAKKPAEGVITSASTKPVPEDVTLATENLVVETTEVPVVEVVEAPAPSVVLIKMERENPRYDIRGHKFTRENPFALVRDEEADYILAQEGFKVASPREAKEYYG